MDKALSHYALGIEEGRKRAKQELHDQFMMAALTGIISNPNYTGDAYTGVAEEARIYADACMRVLYEGKE